MKSLVFTIVTILFTYQITQSSQRSLTASSGGGGGARGGGSVSSGSRPATSSSTPSRASSTPTRTVTSASQSRYSSGLSRYRGPVGVTNLKPGSRAVFVPTGNNYYLWFLLTNNDVEEYGDESDNVSIDRDNLPPGCTLANATTIPTNGTATYDKQFLQQTHTYEIDDLNITCGPVDITTADASDSGLSGAVIFAIVLGSLAGAFVVVVLLMCGCSLCGR